MPKIKEVTVFTNGDSRKLRTWSNVPYFFTKTLESKGIIVNRVDLDSGSFPENVFNKTFCRAIKLITNHSDYSYFRTFAHFTHQRYRIKKACKQYQNTDANIFLTFSFSSAGYTSHKPTIQLGDWTYDYYVKFFAHRKPDFFERAFIRREDLQIESSDIVISLFPSVAEYMKKHYVNKNIYYLGNAVNTLCDIGEDDARKYKEYSNDILFVGKKKYIKGAQELISAFENLKQTRPQLKLHIIGMKLTDFESLPKDVHCYGYLDKGEATDRELYYKLFKEAKVFVNTTPNWGAFSSLIEAMYFYIPIITLPYKNVVETFKKKIDFGYYCEQNSSKLLERSIAKILDNTSYTALCLNAHKTVEKYTWDSYTDKVIRKIELITNK